MRDKYANKPPLQRFLHRYTGVIICFTLLAFGFSYYFYYTENQYFFETWNCDMLYHYLFSGREIPDIPSHDTLTEDEHVRLHEILEECLISDPPPDIFKHG